MRTVSRRLWTYCLTESLAVALERRGRDATGDADHDHSAKATSQAPTRHPLDWRNAEFYDEAALEREMERVFDICHGCRRCVSLCQSFPTLFDLVDNSKTMEVDGVAKADYAQGRRPVLPVRPLLHDEVPVRAAASVERRFSAPHAAREGGQVPAGEVAVARPAADEHRPRGPARDDPRRRAHGQQGQRDAVRAQGDGQGRSASRKAPRCPPTTPRVSARPRAPRSRGRSGTARARRARSRSSRPATSTTTSPASATTCCGSWSTTRFPTGSSRRKPAAGCRSSSSATSSPSRRSRTSTSALWPRWRARATRS